MITPGPVASPGKVLPRCLSSSSLFCPLAAPLRLRGWALCCLPAVSQPREMLAPDPWFSLTLGSSLLRSHQSFTPDAQQEKNFKPNSCRHSATYTPPRLPPPLIPEALFYQRFSPPESPGITKRDYNLDAGSSKLCLCLFYNPGRISAPAGQKTSSYCKLPRLAEARPCCSHNLCSSVWKKQWGGGGPCQLSNACL